MEESIRSLSDKVRFLLNPESYVHRPPSVEAIETHAAWIFLAGEFAYKLKKPVRYESMDYTSIEARRWSCQEEVRLNRRLARDVYFGAIPLAADSVDHLTLNGSGRVVDWLVHMRRLPADLSLDRLIASGPVPMMRIADAALKLASFYRDSASVPVTPQWYRERFRSQIRENLRELGDPIFQMPRRTLDELVAAQERFLEERAGVLDRRVAEGRIIEAHGDLRPEHIYLEPDPSITDCLEFDRRLRLLDPADELSFLTVECELLGQPALGRRFLLTYARLVEEDPPEELLWFYEGFRAFLRARIAIRHLRDHAVRDRSPWSGRALAYLELARSRARRGT